MGLSFLGFLSIMHGLREIYLVKCMSEPLRHTKIPIVSTYNNEQVFEMALGHSVKDSPGSNHTKNREKSLDLPDFSSPTMPVPPSVPRF